jgi:transketolase N-terminal domain/subunit
MALAPLVYTICNRAMNYDPQDPIWPNRDRFVLSNGHASMLLWSILHLTGVQAVNADYEMVGKPAVTLEVNSVEAPRATGWPQFLPLRLNDLFDGEVAE